MFYGLFFIFCIVGVQGGSDLDTDIKGLISYNFPQYSIGANNNGDGYIMTGSIQEFELVKGINGISDTVSFQSITHRGKYLRHRYGLLHLDPHDNTQLFKDDASFYIRHDKFYPGYAALESSNYKGHYLRHQNYRLKLHAEGGDELYKMDASFLVATVALFATIESKNFPNYFWGMVNNNFAQITASHQVTVQLITPGLTGDANSVSFYVPMGNKPSNYLRHRNGALRAEGPNSVKPDLYRKDSTFLFRMDKWFEGYISFESVNYPNHFIRHYGYILYINQPDGSVLFQNDASFKLDIPPREYK